MCVSDFLHTNWETDLPNCRNTDIFLKVILHNEHNFTIYQTVSYDWTFLNSYSSVTKGRVAIQKFSRISVPEEGAVNTERSPTNKLLE